MTSKKYNNDQWWCSAGLNHLIVYPNGNISRCYSRPSHTNIWNFDINKDIHPWKCNRVKCGNCDEYYTTQSKSREYVERNNYIKRKNVNKYPNKLMVQLVVTESCPYFCPYCVHSDRAQQRRNPIKQIDVQEFIEFLEKLPKSFIPIFGGEPILRDDLGQLFKSNKHEYIIVSSCLYKKGIQSVINYLNIYKNKIKFFPTIHPYAKGFEWESFWDNIEMIRKNKYIELYNNEIKMINYKIEDFFEKFKDKCKSLGIICNIEPVDYTISHPDRTDWDYAKSHDLQNNFTNFKNTTQWHTIEDDNVFGFKKENFKKV